MGRRAWCRKRAREFQLRLVGGGNGEGGGSSVGILDADRGFEGFASRGVGCALGRGREVCGRLNVGMRGVME